MSKTYETGHAKNVANFETLIAFVKGYSTAYNPSNVAIKLAALEVKAAEAKSEMENVNHLLAKYNNAVGERELAFEPLSKLSTRIFNAIKASGVSQQQVSSIETNHRKLQGRRASAKLTEAEKQSLIAAGKKADQISASQQSFDNQLDTLDKQIKLLNTIPAYAPNEEELSTNSIFNLYVNLQQKNNIAVSQFAALSTGRLNRNTTMYHPETGILALATDTKNYVKSIFGSSAEYRQIAGLSFKSAK